MIGLAGEIAGQVVVLVLLEGVVAQVAPENGGHAEIVGLREGVADFDDLAAALIGTEINGGADGGGAHVIGFFYGAEEDLVGFVGVGKEFVVIDFDDEGNFVSVLASDRAENAKSRGDGVALAFDSELDDVFAVEVVGVFREAGAGGVLDALIDGKNREIASVTQAAVAEHALKTSEHAHVTVGEGVDAVDEVRAGELQAILGDFRRFEAEKGFSFCAEVGFDFAAACDGCHKFLLKFSTIDLRSMRLNCSRISPWLNPKMLSSGAKAHLLRVLYFGADFSPRSATTAAKAKIVGKRTRSQGLKALLPRLKSGASTLTESAARRTRSRALPRQKID